jgi:hypothetical protein
MNTNKKNEANGRLALVSGSLQLPKILELKGNKAFNYRKLELIKRQISMNCKSIKILEDENDLLIKEAKMIRNEIQEIAEKIDYSFYEKEIPKDA